MIAFRGFLTLTVLVGLLFEDARLLFFLAALGIWALDRFVRIGLAPCGKGTSAPVRGARFRLVLRALSPPAVPLVLLLGLSFPAARALASWRDTHAGQVRALPKATLRDGIWFGQGQGLRGPVRVAVEVREGRVRDVRLLAVAETISVGETAIETLRAEMLDSGHAPERLVTGATHASQGFRDAVHAALVASAFGAPQLPAMARVFLFFTHSDLRFPMLNEVAALLVGAALLAGLVGGVRLSRGSGARPTS